MIDEKLYKNLEYNINNFEKTKRIKSVLRFGNETQIVEPLISFVIPAYSRIKELEIAIRSIQECFISILLCQMKCLLVSQNMESII